MIAQRRETCDYTGYGQGVGGMFSLLLGALHMYELSLSGSGSEASGPSGPGGYVEAAQTLPHITPIPHGVPVPLVVWYGPRHHMSGGGGMPKHPGLMEVSALVPPRFGSTGQSRGAAEQSFPRPTDPRGGPVHKSN